MSRLFGGEGIFSVVATAHGESRRFVCPDLDLAVAFMRRVGSQLESGRASWLDITDDDAPMMLTFEDGRRMVFAEGQMPSIPGRRVLALPHGPHDGDTEP